MDCLIVHPMSVLLATIGKHGATLTIVSREKHTLLVSLSACLFTVMMRPGQKDTSNLMF